MPGRTGDPRRVVGQFPGVPGDDPPGGSMEVSRPGVVSHAFPRFQHFLERSRPQIFHCRETVHESVVVGTDLVYPRLLEHDFRNPDRVRIGRPAPGHFPFVCRVPGEQGAAKRFDPAGIRRGIVLCFHERIHVPPIRTVRRAPACLATYLLGWTGFEDASCRVSRVRRDAAFNDAGKARSCCTRRG